MSEQPSLFGMRVVLDDTVEPGTIEIRPTLTDRQQQAFDYVRNHDGVTAEQVGAHLHERKGKHAAADPCQWCQRDGRSVLTSKALAPLVTYRTGSGERVYVVRNRADRVRAAEPRREPTEAELQANPFAGL